LINYDKLVIIIIGGDFMSKLLTTNDICEKYGVHKNTVDKWRKRGMPFLYINKRVVRYDISEIENWIKENTQKLKS
jgi:predicted DNA-binding transcriptional regulator AlpA